MHALQEFVSKHILEEALDLLATVEREKAIAPTDEQRADLYFEPRPNRPPLEEIPHIGRPIWRMSERRGIAELCSEPPSVDDAREYVRKQLNLHHGLVLKTPKTPPPVPDLWIISAGRPDSVLKKLKLKPVDGSPAGFYFDDYLSPMWLIVLPELPVTPETRLLRLCGSRELRTAAVDEIESLPPEDPTRQPLLSMLFVIRHLLSDKPELAAEDPNTMTQARQNAERALQDMYRQGMSRGQSDSKAEDVLAVLAAKGIPVSAALQEQIRTCTDLTTLQRWLLRAVTATRAEDVLKAA